MNFDLSDAQQSWRDSAGAVGRSLPAHAPASEAIVAAVRAGLLEPGVDLLGAAVVVEALAYESASAAIAFALHASVLRGIVDAAGARGARPDVAALEQGTTVGALAMSSDDVPTEEGGRLTGRASWVVPVTERGVVMVGARAASGGRTAWLVPLDAAGAHVERVVTAGLRGLVCGHAVLKDAPGSLVGATEPIMCVVRILLAAAGLGMGRRAMRESLEAAKAYGRTGAGGEQTVQGLLADSATELDAAMLLTWKAASTPTRSLADASMAKLAATEATQRAVARATQVVGSDSFRAGHVIERLSQDVRGLELFAGRTEALREAVALETLTESRIPNPESRVAGVLSSQTQQGGMSSTRLSAVILLLMGVAWASTMRPRAAPQQGTTQAGTAQAGTSQSDPPKQQPAETPSKPATFRGQIDFIRVDAFVTDRNGRPVTDLKQTDFELIEDGKPQKIEQFDVVKIEGPPRPGTEPAEPVRRIRNASDEEDEARREDVRVFVLFLDEYHTRDRNAVMVKDSLVRFINTGLRPLDMVAVMYPLTPADDVTFTRDHEAVIRALQGFEGRKYNYVARNAVEREVEREPPAVIEKVRNQIVYSAIESLTYRLGGLRDGRKSVIFVSEGFTTLLPPQMRQTATSRGVGNSDPTVEREAMEHAELELESRMRDVYKAANRNNTAFYPLDPRGLAVFEFDIADGGAAASPVDMATDARTLKSTQETLRNLAIETGGRAIINRNTLVEGLAEMLRDSSYYYLLGYTTQAPTDGKFHNIKVRVKRSGVEVRSRNGYWAYTTDDIKRMNSPKPEVAKPVQLALASIASPVQAARFVRTWVGTERGDGGKTRVTLVWEALPLQPNVRQEQAGRVSLLAIDAQGAQVFRGRSPEALPSPTAAVPPAGGAAGARGAPAAPPIVAGPQRIVFDAPPGKLEMRLRVEGVTGGTLDDETRTLDLPDLTSPQARLSTPKVFRSRNAREFQAAVADAGAVPIAAREFSRTERLLIRFDAYGPGSEKPVPTAVLLSRTGQKIAELPVAAAVAGGTHQIDLPLNTMAAGEYLIEIAVKDSAGNEAKDLVALRIGA